MISSLRAIKSILRSGMTPVAALRGCFVASYEELDNRLPLGRPGPLKTPPALEETLTGGLSSIIIRLSFG